MGSPTIRVDGADLQPAGEEPAGLTCRLYRLRDGRVSPPPDPADLREALRGRNERSYDDHEHGTSRLGDPAPAFDLPDTEGGTHSLSASGRGPTAVVFTCNHCPYALAWHDRIAGVARGL